MNVAMTKSDCFGLVKPAVDAHTLGITAVQQLLKECGHRSVVADASMCQAFGFPDDPVTAAVIMRWIAENHITHLGFSYRLDPAQGAGLFGRLVRYLNHRHLLSEQGGPIRALYFAGLPQTCALVKSQHPGINGLFSGNETPAETLRILGISAAALPREAAEGMAYDEDRLSFGRDLIRKGDYLAVAPADHSGYDGYGTRRDTLVARLRHAQEHDGLPLTRAHVGPYSADREDSVRLFLEWARTLAASGYLDVLSIGTSQLTQSSFGEHWGVRPNGGGVPLNSPEEFAKVWDASRPMLVRAYAGTKDIPALAKMYEETINIAWHALSLWWFCRIDGRGPLDMRENLRQHVETLKYMAATGKPFEPNVPHHFAFRGADDATCVVSAYLAAKLAKTLGIRDMVLQVMLNTPKYTWGIQDLAKARAMLRLVRRLEDDSFRVILQPRGGLDYFSPDMEKARAQLAAVSALMDDIEPHDVNSPEIVHVVGYSEASHLADPSVVDESIKITRHAIQEYRRLRLKGDVDDMADHPEVKRRTRDLLREALTIIEGIESMVPDAYSAEGLYKVFASGFLPAPWLWECREEFQNAVHWRTQPVKGSVKVVDECGGAISAEQRVLVVRSRENVTLM